MTTTFRTNTTSTEYLYYARNLVKSICDTYLNTTEQ